MADDVKIKYGSSGFERVRKELREMELIGATSGTWFKSMQKALKDAEESGSSSTKSLTSGLSSLASAAGGTAVKIAAIGTAVTAVAAVVTGVGVAAFTSWSMSVLKTSESFRMLETSLYGATKSWEAVNTVSEFAKKYAAEYPAMYGDIMKAMQSFAYIPALKPMIMKGDVEEMHKMMTIVQGLMTMRPEQGVGGAIWALREALAGNWRTLMMRFDVPIASIAKSAGMTLEEMKRSPAEAIKALKSFIDEFVGADTMAMMAKNLSIQVGNLRDKYEMWLDKLGKMGVYQKAVDYLLKLNEAMERFMASERFQKWTVQINQLLESVVDRVAGIFTKGIDWESIATLGDLGGALKKVGKNAIDELRTVWEVAKEPLAGALTGVFKFVGNAAIEAFKEVLLPGLKGIMGGLKKTMEEYSLESPLMASLGRMGAVSGAGGLLFGPKGLLLGPALEALRGYGEIIGFIADKAADGISAIEGGLESLFGTITENMEGLAEQPKQDLEDALKSLKEIKEMLGMPEIKSPAMRKWLGLEPLAEVPERGGGEFQKWMARPFKGWTGPWGEAAPERPLSLSEIERTISEWYLSQRLARVGAEKEPTVWTPKAKSELELYGSWARMAKAMAEREEVETPFEIEQKRLVEYKAAKEKWEYGQMTTEDWRLFSRKFETETDKRIRLQDFDAEREKRLSLLLEKAVAEKDVGVQSRVYGELFNIAYQRGDFGRAQDYMNKQLDAMIESLKKSEKFEEEDNESLKAIKESTGKTADILEKWKVGEGRYSNIPKEEKDEMVRLIRDAGEA